MNTTAPIPVPHSALPVPRFYIVRWRGYPLYFHENFCGRMYSPKALDTDATRFPTPELAWTRAQEHHLRWADIVIVPLETRNSKLETERTP